jgi:hypothetical protein
MGHIVAHGFGLPTQPSPAQPGIQPTVWRWGVRVGRGHRVRWHAGRRPGGARSAMRFYWRAPRGLQGGAGQDLMDQGLPACSGDGEAAMDGCAEKFISVGWAPATGDVLG